MNDILFFFKMVDQCVNIKGGELKWDGYNLFQVGEFLAGQEQLD